MITVLCAKKNSLYKTIPGIDVWDEDRDAYFFTGSNPVITHAPCAQWSVLKGLAKNKPDEKELAYFCLTKVIRNGGIFEHPAGSSFFKEAGVTKNIYSVDQSWWGYKARKKTYLFFHLCKPLAFPILRTIPTHMVDTSKRDKNKQYSRRVLPKGERSTTVLPFAQYLIDCINASVLLANTCSEDYCCCENPNSGDVAHVSNCCPVHNYNPYPCQNAHINPTT